MQGIYHLKNSEKQNQTGKHQKKFHPFMFEKRTSRSVVLFFIHYVIMVFLCFGFYDKAFLSENFSYISNREEQERHMQTELRLEVRESLWLHRKSIV